MDDDFSRVHSFGPNMQGIFDKYLELHNTYVKSFLFHLHHLILF